MKEKWKESALGSGERDRAADAMAFLLALVLTVPQPRRLGTGNDVCRRGGMENESGGKEVAGGNSRDRASWSFGGIGISDGIALFN